MYDIFIHCTITDWFLFVMSLSGLSGIFIEFARDVFGDVPFTWRKKIFDILITSFIILLIFTLLSLGFVIRI